MHNHFLQEQWTQMPAKSYTFTIKNQKNIRSESGQPCSFNAVCTLFSKASGPQISTIDSVSPLLQQYFFSNGPAILPRSPCQPSGAFVRVYSNLHLSRFS